MYEIYVYNADNEQWTVIEELTNTELIKVAECVEHELDRRAFDKLDVFEAEDTGESKGVKLLRFQYLFKDWEGYVKKMNTVKRTLCWSCDNAVPDGTNGCDWSREFKPVEGWDAERKTMRTDGKNGRRELVSYSVNSCPKFKKVRASK